MTQCVVNVVGDVLLVRNWGMGLPGAAWATVAAQLLGAAALLVALFQPGRVRLAHGSNPRHCHFFRWGKFCVWVHQYSCVGCVAGFALSSSELMWDALNSKLICWDEWIRAKLTTRFYLHVFVFLLCLGSGNHVSPLLKIWQSHGDFWVKHIYAVKGSGCRRRQKQCMQYI
jgi:hypothetical protein